MTNILVVEDELAISQVLKVYLQRANYEVIQAFDGDTALKFFHEHQPSLVLLDVMLPGKDGWTLLNIIREESDCPVIMLTALDDINYRLTGLHGGADDYITKPFIADEVVARVQTVLRRVKSNERQEEIKQYGSLKIDFKGHKISVNDQELVITPRDLSLLLFLADHPNQTFTRDQLIDRVWGMDYEGSDRAVDLAIKRLRKVLQEWPREEGEIRTLRGLGYQFHVY